MLVNGTAEAWKTDRNYYSMVVRLGEYYMIIACKILFSRFERLGGMHT